MRFSVAATAAFVGAAAAQYGNSTTTAAPVYVTEVVTAYTTYCPSATEITHGGVTYTVTEATTLTITNCPCTITKPVASSVVTSCVSSYGNPQLLRNLDYANMSLVLLPSTPLPLSTALVSLLTTTLPPRPALPSTPLAPALPRPPLLLPASLVPPTRLSPPPALASLPSWASLLTFCKRLA